MKQKLVQMAKSQPVNLNDSPTKSSDMEGDIHQKVPYTPYCNFKTTLYKDQKAQSQRIFRRKVYT